MKPEDALAIWYLAAKRYDETLSHLSQLGTMLHIAMRDIRAARMAGTSTPQAEREVCRLGAIYDRQVAIVNAAQTSMDEADRQWCEVAGGVAGGEVSHE